MCAKNFIVGQNVLYCGLETHIESIDLENDSCIIANPFWDWGDEAICVSQDQEYDVSYWLNVNINELEKI